MLLHLLMMFGLHCGFLSEFFDYALDTIMEFIWYIKSCKLVHIEAAFRLAEEHLIVESALLYFVNLILFKPFDSLAFLPEAELGRLAGDFISSEPMLLATAPMATIGTSIGPCVDTEAMLLVILIFASVLPSVLPCVHTNSIHVIIDPLSFKLAPIKPRIRAQTPNLILLPLAIVPGAVIPAVDALAVLLAGQVLTLVD